MGNNEPAVDQSDFRIRDSYGLSGSIVRRIEGEPGANLVYQGVLIRGGPLSIQHSSMQYLHDIIV